MLDDYQLTPVDLEWAELAAQLLAADSLQDLIATVQQPVMDRDLAADDKAPHARALVRLILVRDRVGALHETDAAKTPVLAQTDVADDLG